MTTTDLVRLNVDEMARVSKALAQSQRFGQLSIEAAFVSVLAGQELGIPPFAAITGIHVIQGKPVLGAGILAGLVKASSKYDYRVHEHTDEVCVIAFFEGGDYVSGDYVGDSSFSMADAVRAGLPSKNPNWKIYPRNMLFARAMSNGVAWYCPDLTAGRYYTEGEIEEPDAAPVRDVVAEVTVDADPPPVAFPLDLPDVQRKPAREKPSAIERRDKDDAKADAEAAEDPLFNAAFDEVQRAKEGEPAYSAEAAS